MSDLADLIWMQVRPYVAEANRKDLATKVSMILRDHELQPGPRMLADIDGTELPDDGSIMVRIGGKVRRAIVKGPGPTANHILVRTVDQEAGIYAGLISISDVLPSSRSKLRA